MSAQSRVHAFADSLTMVRQRLARQSSSYVSPYYYRLVGPATYYASAINPLFALNDGGEAEDENDALNREIDHQLATLYMEHPELVRHYDGQFANVTLVEAKESEQQNISNELQQVLAPETQVPNIDEIHEDIGDIGLKVEKPNFWKRSGKFGLQFTQNYFSENWYKGGNNTQSMLATVLLEAKYDDQKKLTWENKLDMRLGFVTTPSDTCHNFLTNNDKLNLYSKLGVKATKKSWFYTATFEANTQFMPGYRTNDRRTYSNFLAPLDVYFSLGMDYKPKLANGNELSVALLPLSYKMRYIGERNENIHQVYNMVGKDFQQDFGSKVEVNTKLKLAKDFMWRCRFYYFSSYKYTESELENVFTYQLSKYISTELFTLWRFDDNRSHDYYDRNIGYFQFKEFFTLGLTYEF